MDRPLHLPRRFARDRRSPVGDELAHVVLEEKTITFDDLLERLERADVRDIAGWLGHAIDRGAIEEIEPGRFGARRFRLRPAGLALLAQARRADDSHSPTQAPAA